MVKLCTEERIHDMMNKSTTENLKTTKIFTSNYYYVKILVVLRFSVVLLFIMSCILSSVQSFTTLYCFTPTFDYYFQVPNKIFTSLRLMKM